jgi:hypothetical protein
MVLTESMQMILSHTALAALGLALGAPAPVASGAPAPVAPGSSGPVAIRVGRAETASHGAIEHAVILVEGGKITAIGQDLEIARGIAIVDRPEWVAMPGLVHCWSRLGQDSDGGSALEPQIRASAELFAAQDVWKKLLEAGVTTLGLYPAGSGVPGQAVAVRPAGDTPQAMTVADPAYLMVYLSASSAAKKTLREGFDKADEYDEKVAKEKEKWEKEQEKKSKSKKDDKKDEKKEEEKKEEKKDSTAGRDGEDEKKDEKKEDAEVFVPPAPDEKAAPFVDWRAGRLRALVHIGKAADWLHLLDVLGEEEVEFDLRVPMRDDLDLYYVIDQLGERHVRVVCEPRITFMVNTRRERDLPAELAAAGAKVAFVPRIDSIDGCKTFAKQAGELVGWGLDREVALRALTLEPAAVLGLDERLGSLDVGKDANILFFDGDPLEAATELESVMLEGRFVTGPDSSSARGRPEHPATHSGGQ